MWTSGCNASVAPQLQHVLWSPPVEYDSTPRPNVLSRGTKATPCVEVWQTSNLRRLRLGEEKRIRKKKKPEDENIMVCPMPYGDHKEEEDRRNHRAKI